MPELNSENNFQVLKVKYLIYCSLISIILFQHANVYGQNSVIDSLANLLRQAPQKEKPGLLNQMGKEYLRFDLDKARKTVSDARKLSQQIGNKTEEARSFQNEGNICIRENDFETAILKFGEGVKAAEKSKDKKTESSLLSDLGFAYENIGDFSHSLQYYQRALKLRQSIKDEYGIGLSYNHIGGVLRSMGQYDEAIKNHRLSLKIFQQEKDEKGQSEALNNIGNVHYNWANYDSALFFFHQSLALKEKLGNQSAISRTLSNIGGVHYELANYNKALEYFFRFLDIQRKNNNFQGIATSEVNIGLVYYDMKEFELALRYYNDAMVWLEKINNESAMALTLGNIGLVYLEKQEYKRALGYYLRALKLKEVLADTFGLAQTFHQLGYTYFYLKNYSNALKYNQKSFEIARRNDLKKQIYESLHLFSEIYAAKLDYANAYEYFVKYSQMKDSVVNTEKLAQITDIQEKYESSRKDKAIIELKHDKLITELKLDKHKMAIWVIVSAILLAIGIFWLLFSHWKVKNQKKELALQFRNLEIEHRLVQTQMNPHFLFNSLTSIQNYLIKDNNEPAIRHLSKFASLLRRILENSRKSLVPLSEETETLELYLALEKLRDPGRFDYSISVEENIDSEEIDLPPMIIQPFVENCIKHAFRGLDRKGNIMIHFKIEGEDLVCIVEDNGRGRRSEGPDNQSNSAHKSLGIQLIFDRIELFRKLGKNAFGIEVVDLFDANQACGTKVIIRFRQKN
jgi:tetratricopeptide (TPR) repeat protein